MKGEKKSRVDLLEKKTQALIKIVQKLLDENTYLKDLSVGTLETIKQMPDYDEAIEKLKNKVAKDAGEKQKTKPLAKVSD